MFCPKCGGLMVPRLINNKRILSCSCGYSDKSAGGATLREEVKKAVSIEVVDKGDDETLPETEAECPKCKNKVAWYWLIQTRAADEPETKFLKCKKCRHVWRDYS